MTVEWERIGDEWQFTVFNGEEIVTFGHTHVVNLELYDCETVEDYILKWCIQKGGRWK